MISIERNIAALGEELRKIARDLHQIPESGFEEYKTSAYIIEKLKSIGVEVYSGIAQTGVIGLLRGSENKETIAFRADMDALSVEEKTNLPYASKHSGMMHACGHDAHMTILLGLAKYLVEHRKNLKQNIVFLFQPAEEGPGGAEPMIQAGVLEQFHIDKILGLHVFPEVDAGRVAARPGPMMAQAGEFDILIKGRSGHGAIPHMAKDAIVAAAALVSSFQSIVSRSIDPMEGAIVTIGKMWGGERRNIIAGEVHLEGTVRAFREEVFENIKRRMKLIIQGIETAYECSIELVFRDMYPAVTNDEKLFEDFVEAVGKEHVDVIAPQMIAEDFSYFQKEIPGLFFFLGVKNEKLNCIYPLHNCLFQYPEETLMTGLQVYIQYLRHVGVVAPEPDAEIFAG
ncbi:M20 metallopeptidase family protein [Geosporobacter ferrireducens]|uniref:M20 metallopeptidase family protein n=1 Tax=Geosporobacter ferrireducens TaxID=1424294 RepID=UPI00139BF9FE|nr:amidohydrolase [Geosporobacter ferrireducens]MTI56490.1 N-acetyldiaminopimelate deacetylase [Geosporobacter ferrireducens]